MYRCDIKAKYPATNNISTRLEGVYDTPCSADDRIIFDKQLCISMIRNMGRLSLSVKSPINPYIVPIIIKCFTILWGTLPNCKWKKRKSEPDVFYYLYYN